MQDEVLSSAAENFGVIVRLGDLAEVGTGSSNRNESDDSGQYPFFVRSRTVFSSSEFEFDEHAIVIPGEGGIGEIFHFVDGKYALHQRAYRIHVTSPDLLPKYLLYYMKSNFKRFITARAVSATVTSIRRPMILDFPVQVPPIEQQNRVVKILDEFESLEELLSEELEARRRQYEHYRSRLLGEATSHIDLAWSPLGDIATIQTGTRPADSELNAGGRVPYLNGGVVPSGSVAKTNSSSDTITIPARGSVGRVSFNEKAVWVGPLCYQVNSKDKGTLLPRFLYHWLKSNEKEIVSLQQTGSIPALNKKQLAQFRVPTLDIPTQEGICNVLDPMAALISESDFSLEREIVERRKQYEYYRNKLLTF